MVLRQQYWIDGEVQGILVGRVLLYAAAAVLYVVLGSLCFQFWHQPEWSVQQHLAALFEQLWPWAPSFLLFLPLVLHDVIRLSNLFVGPIYRLRSHLAELTANPTCRPLKFREDDYWQDLEQPINHLQNEILALRIVVDRMVEKQALERLAAQATEGLQPTVEATSTDGRIASSTWTGSSQLGQIAQ